MEIRNQKPVSGSEPRRFTAKPAAPKPGAKSFASALDKAVTGSVPGKPAPAASETAQPAEAAATPAAANPPLPADGKTPSDAAAAAPADSEAAFADHMEMVRFRLKTGYYASKALDDALTDKLSGFFDELA
jgi:hypothetical protein